MFQLNAELRSITSMCVVEDVSKCPLGYTPIVRTHDQETDADLWKDGFFRKVTRYVCVSKSQGRPEHVIQGVQILHEKECPPEGFSVIQQTTDTCQKAFKKKQLCFKHAHFRSNVESIVDVVILNKLKNPPDGYDHIGDINGMHFLIRKVSALTRNSMPGLSYGVLPGVPGNPVVYPSLHDSINNLNINSNGVANNLPSADRFHVSAPNSPAHVAMSMGQDVTRNNYANNTGTLSHLTGLEGVPFILRDDLRPGGGGPGSISYGGSRMNPIVNIKSEFDIEKEYQYDFHAERDVISNIQWD